MSGLEKWVSNAVDVQRRVDRLEATSQLGNSTLAGDAAVPVQTVIEGAAVTNDAMPIVQDDAADGNEGVSDLQVSLEATDDDLDARLADALADLADARAELELAQEAINEAFGAQLTGLSDRVDQIVVGAGGTLILFSDEGPAGTAPTGSTWFMINEAENIVGQWQQTGQADAPVWTPRAIESSVIANLDVGKLTAGQAALAQVVAMKIAAATADVQTVNVGNLFVTQGATMQQAVIEYLFANVVAAKKITADMLDVNSLNGVSVTGLLLKTAATGQRLELQKTSMLFYSATSTTAVGAIFAEDRGAFSSVTIQNSYGTETSFATFNVPRNPSAGSYESTRKLNLELSHGLTAPVMQVRQLFGSGDYGGRKYPVIDSTQVNGAYTGMVVNADEFRLGTNDPRSVISRTNGNAASPTSVQVTADSYVQPDGFSVLPLTGNVAYSGTLASDASGNLTVNFEPGRFGVAPAVVATASNSRVTVGISSTSTSSVTFTLSNWSNGPASNFTVRFIAAPATT